MSDSVSNDGAAQAARAEQSRRAAEEASKAAATEKAQETKSADQQQQQQQTAPAAPAEMEREKAAPEVVQATRERSLGAEDARRAQALAPPVDAATAPPRLGLKNADDGRAQNAVATDGDKPTSTLASTPPLAPTATTPTTPEAPTTPTTPTTPTAATTPAAPTPAERAAATRAGIEKLRDPAVTGRDRAQRVAEAARSVEDGVKGRSPDEQKAFLDGVGADAIQRLGSEIKKDPKPTEAVAALARAGEALGAKNVDALAKPLTEGLKDRAPNSLEDRRQKLAVGNAFAAAAQEGNGARLGAAVARADKGSLRQHVAAGTLNGVDAAREKFNDAAASKADTDRRVAQHVAEARAHGVSEDKIAKGVEAATKEPNAAAEEAARKAATNLEGAADLAAQGQPRARDAIAQAPALATTEAGRAAFAEALHERGAGNPSFLDQAQAQAKTPADKARLELATSFGGAQGAIAREAAGDSAGAARVLEGASQFQSDPAARAAVKDAAATLRDQAAKDPTLDAAKQGTLLAQRLTRGAFELSKAAADKANATAPAGTAPKAPNPNFPRALSALTGLNLAAATGELIDNPSLAAAQKAGVAALTFAEPAAGFTKQLAGAAGNPDLAKSAHNLNGALRKLNAVLGPALSVASAGNAVLRGEGAASALTKALPAIGATAGRFVAGAAAGGYASPHAILGGLIGAVAVPVVDEARARSRVGGAFRQGSGWNGPPAPAGIEGDWRL